MTRVSSLYLHVPFCQHLCNYCDFYKRKLDSSSQQFEDFHQFLRNSMDRHGRLLSENGYYFSPFETIYLGGGTPSLWGGKGAGFFQSLLPVSMKKDGEFTMEIDPGTWNPDMIKAWKEVGLNRISIGTQTLNPTFLKIMDRVHSLEDSLNFLKVLQKDQWNYSLDFLLGIPFSREKKRNIKEELDKLLEFSPKHISLYILNARSKYPHIQNMPDDDFIREEYLFVSEYLRSLGFHHYEVSNFALPGFESRHNQKYWRGEAVAALGPTGVGYLPLSENRARRYKWKVSEAEVEIEELHEEELTLEKIYLSLRTSDGWTPSEKQRPLMEKWVSQKFGSWQGPKMVLNALGFLMLDSLMDDLFRWDIHHK